MEHRLVIFAGAGASFGVSSRYPMTKQFFDELPSGVTGSDLFKRLTTFLSSKNSIDIEDVLWTLGDLLDAVESATAEGRILKFLLRKNALQALLGSGPSGNDFASQLSHLQRLAGDLQRKIHDEVYRFYSALPAADDLNRTWTPLLRWARGLSPQKVDIVTTNYDRVLESALDTIDDLPVDTGKRASVEVRLNLALWDKSSQGDKGLLTKLHGSVDWTLAGTDSAGQPIIRWGQPEHQGLHDNRGIIYPGFKGSPEKEPFKSFHDYFGTAASKATHLLFIGFAFRDDYINDLLARSLSPTAKIAVIDPASMLPDLPFLKNIKHLQIGFGASEPIAVPAMPSSAPGWLNELQHWAEQT